jgi:predicted phosphodiesterase
MSRAHNLDRRTLLLASGSAALGTALAWPTQNTQAQESDDNRLAFFVIGDTHYLADKTAPDKIAPDSADICGRLVQTMNDLAGKEIPATAGGGKVVQPRGVIHAGDIIDTGDKQGKIQEAMQQTEWQHFQADYGLNGKNGKLKFPVYEVFGNHDAPHGKGLVLDGIRERNKQRPHVTNISDNGLHYSWDWGPVHFINVGLIVGTDQHIARKRRYAALDSLDFLVADLREKVGKQGKPVVITHHVDIARYTGMCDTQAPPDSKEWDTCDVSAFYTALQGYNVAAIFYGHTHARNVFRWNGVSAKAQTGIHVFNTDNASHFHGKAQAFMYVEMTPTEMIVREYATQDRWESGAFTPQVWKHAIPG